MKQTPVASECTFLFVMIMELNLPVPDFKSSFEKYLADRSDASISSMTGSGRVYFFVILLGALKSTQNLLLPSFFFTKTIGKPHGLLDLSITPACIISSTAESIIFLCLRGMRYRRFLMGSCVPVSIRISTVWVLPRFLSSLTNKSLFLFSSLSISGLNCSGACAYSTSTSGLLLFCFSGIVISVILPALSNSAIGHPRLKVIVWFVLFIISNGNLRELAIFTTALATDIPQKLLTYPLLNCSISYSLPAPFLNLVCPRF